MSTTPNWTPQNDPYYWDNQPYTQQSTAYPTVTVKQEPTDHEMSAAGVLAMSMPAPHTMQSSYHDGWNGNRVYNDSLAHIQMPPQQQYSQAPAPSRFKHLLSLKMAAEKQQQAADPVPTAEQVAQNNAQQLQMAASFARINANDTVFNKGFASRHYVGVNVEAMAKPVDQGHAPQPFSSYPAPSTPQQPQNYQYNSMPPPQNMMYTAQAALFGVPPARSPVAPTPVHQAPPQQPQQAQQAYWDMQVKTEYNEPVYDQPPEPESIVSIQLPTRGIYYASSGDVPSTLNGLAGDGWGSADNGSGGQENGGHEGHDHGHGNGDDGMGGDGGNGGYGGSEGDGSDQGKHGRGKGRKLSLACHFCRRRKLKCDGTKPVCDTCTKRGETCTWDENVRRRGPGKATKERREKAAREALAAGLTNNDSLHNRPSVAGPSSSYGASDLPQGLDGGMEHHHHEHHGENPHGIPQPDPSHAHEQGHEHELNLDIDPTLIALSAVMPETLAELEVKGDGEGVHVYESLEGQHNQGGHHQLEHGQGLSAAEMEAQAKAALDQLPPHVQPHLSHSLAARSPEPEPEAKRFEEDDEDDLPALPQEHFEIEDLSAHVIGQKRGAEDEGLDEGVKRLKADEVLVSGGQEGN
ncbi:hypothetical protein B9479_001219 [Cryptococcus floricola]|uniref:Zn(2)-C6 fungal-type domain-containing protein n=1 Tax=Cryptococcus floricola TaxID=2591691 RepID=A0A5D3B7I7_9TREE|nr:hypothetical protein B9479_001219 [Cryptococcus floricola]